MPYRYLQVERTGSVEYLTLNRPDVRNAFNEELIGELTEWAVSVTERFGPDRPRVVVLAGAGKVFCAGADVAWMAKTVQFTEEENLLDAAAAAGLFAAIDALPVPVIGRVHGAALGGGAGLTAVCDIVVADQDAIFGFTEVKLGILPAVISPFVISKIGRSAARELFLTGARFSAMRAREIGLVHSVVPSAELDSTVARYVEEILTGAPEAIAEAKALIKKVSETSADEAMPHTARAIASRRASREGQEGLRAFLEKRTPSWVRLPITTKGTKDTKDRSK
jgi:methylglutaconyl-CoA hydratase